MNNLMIVCGTLESGGAERVISILSKPFADKFKNVTIITWREAPIFYNIDTRVTIISLPQLAHSNRNITKIFVLRKYIRQCKPNLILSFLTIFNLFTIISSIGLKIPVIVAERNDPNYIKGGFIMKKIRNFLYTFSNGILCQTQSIQDYFKKPLRKKTHIIYNPITLPCDYIGKALLTTKEKSIVSVGRLHPQKNQKLLIDSFIAFHHKHPNYKLIIYGTGQLKEALQEHINKNNIAGNIILAGERKDVKDLILNAEMFIMTSQYEGMPNALIEAMCLGLPCVSTRVSGAVDLIQNNENGILVNSSVTDIREAMESVTDNPKFAEKIAKNATSIYENLNVNHISQQWIDYLTTKLES